MDKIEKLLKELTEASGISGHETEIRGVIKNHLRNAGELSQDKMGSVICKKKGTVKSPVLMLEAHMDEIGFLVSQITDEGFIRFVTIGGWWEHVLLTQRVCIQTGKGNITGIIGAKAPHLLTDDERNKLLPVKKMYIDIGATSRKEVDNTGVSQGDPVVPVSEFTLLPGSKSYLGKAFDNRAGCAVVITTLNNMVNIKHPNTLLGTISVQEEVGTRGAKTAVAVANPDVAIILESSAATDTPGGASQEEKPIKLGAGPILTVFRGDMIPNQYLLSLVKKTAEKYSIPLQYRIGGISGSTDGAVIHVYNQGVPTVVLSLPVRNVHSHSSIMHRDDFDNLIKLLTHLVQVIDKKAFEKMIE
jgi:endoglucanase